MKVEFEKVDEKESFLVWKVRMEDLLFQLGLDLALEKRSEDMTDLSEVLLKRGAREKEKGLIF